MGITGTGINLFCMILLGEIYFFQRKNFDRKGKQYIPIYLFSVLGLMCSTAELFLKNECLKSIVFIFGGCSYVLAVLYLCRHFFKKGGRTNGAMQKTMTALILMIYAAVIIIAEKNGFNIAAYIPILGVTAAFATDQYDTIRTDKLTKLYNRYGMDAELKEQLRQYEREHEDSFYIIACDLDNFKHINDTWGHPEGDRALVLIAGVLSKVAKKFRSNVFRIGGDEFVIITDTSEKGLADDVTAAVKNELDNLDFRDDFDIKMSIGVALYDGVTSIDVLLNRADKKLYRASLGCTPALLL